MLPPAELLVSRLRAAAALLAAWLVGVGAALFGISLRHQADEMFGRAELPPWFAAAAVAGAVVAFALGRWLAARKPGRALAGMLFAVAAGAGLLLFACWPQYLWPDPTRLLALALPALGLGVVAFGLCTHGWPRLWPAALACALAGAGLVLYLGPLLEAPLTLVAAAQTSAACWLLAGVLAPRGMAAPAAPAARGAGAAGALVVGLTLVTVALLQSPLVRQGLPATAPTGLLLLGLAVGGLVAALLQAVHLRLSPRWLAALVAAAALAGHLAPSVVDLPAGLQRCLPLAAGALLGLLLGAGLGAGSPRAFGGGAVLAAGLVLAAAAVPSIAWLPILPAAVALLAALLLLRTPLLALPVAGFAAVVLLLPPPTLPAAWPGGREVLLARRGTGEVLYRRDRHEVQEWVGGVLVDAAGPRRGHAAVLVALQRLLAPDAGHVGLLGIGTGRVLSCCAGASAWITVVDHRAADDGLFGALQADGPVPMGAVPTLQLPPAAVAVHCGQRQWLLRQPAGSLDVALVTAPLGAGEPFVASETFQLAARTALGAGVLLQCAYLDEAPPALLAQLLAVATAVHPHCRLLLWRDLLVLVASGAPLDLDATAARWPQLPDELQWQLHAAGCGSGDDLLLADLGGFAAPQLSAARADAGLWPVRAGGAARVANLLLLRALQAKALPSLAGALRLDCEAADAAVRQPALRALAQLQRQHLEAMLPGDVSRRAYLRDVENAARQIDPADAAAVARLAALAASSAHLGCPGAMTQAALALSNRIGEQVLTAPTAAARALAIDPMLALDPPAVLAPLLPAAAPPSPLEDFAVLPDGARLAELCAGDSPLAVALRVVFPSCCSRALLAVRAERPWRLQEVAALRELADPFVLRQAAARLLPLQRSRELIGLWRRDLPMPAALSELLAGGAEDRKLLAGALAGHDDARSAQAVAALLGDNMAEVRTAAAAALFQMVGERIPYDPEWPESRRRDASDRLRALHNHRHD